MHDSTGSQSQDTSIPLPTALALSETNLGFQDALGVSAAAIIRAAARNGVLQPVSPAHDGGRAAFTAVAGSCRCA